MTTHDLPGRQVHERGLELAAMAVDFELTRAETAELEAHLAGCPSCTRRAAALRGDAVALGRPLVLLPSARVDAAIAAEIAGRRAGPQRLVLVAAAAMLALALLGAAAVGAYLLRNVTTPPITEVTPVTPPAVASPRPDASAVASPSAGPSQTVPDAAAIDPVVMLRVNFTTDTGGARYPSMTVYRDGTVVSQGGAMTRLTPDGMGLLMAPAMQSDLLVTSGEIDVDPAFVGGGGGSSIELRRGEVIVRRETIHSDAAVPAQRAEAQRIEALAARLADHESWLPADAWTVAPTAAARYTPVRFRLMMAIEDGPAGPDPALDVADIDWPLAGRLEEFGQAEVEAVEGWSFRCGPLTLVEALAVQRALAAAPLRPEGESLEATLDWPASRKHLTVSLVPLLPDDPSSCTVVGDFPSRGPETTIDPVVLLRVDILPDVSVGRMPSLTVYRDGTVLRRDDPSGSITRLTSEGLGLLMAAASADRLFGASGSIGPDPTYAGGFTSYSITLRRGEAAVVRSTTNAPAQADRAEAESIIALAEHLDDLDTWLPSSAWAEGPRAASPYVASDYLLKVTVFKQPGVDYPPQPLDRADVDWPLAGSLEGFGELAEDQPLGSGTTSRCGVLTLAEAVAVQGALAVAPFNAVAENLQAELDWAPSIGHVTVTLVPLLPDDRRECAVDRSWP
jgi:hypothetical protein